MKKDFIILVIVLPWMYSSSIAINPIPQAKYLEFARASAEWTWDHYDSIITSWEQNIDPNYVFGYNPPGRILEMATIYAYLFELAVRAVPDHPQAKTWKMLEKSIEDDNWGNWEIEDASLYNAIWLYSLLGYADALRKMDAFFNTPEMYYNDLYFLHLMCPEGMIPDFGDANWHSSWDRYLVFFEATVKVLNWSRS